MKETVETLVTDEQIDNAWGNAYFGEGLTKREVVANTLLKYACGYSSGHTALCICTELGLLKTDRNGKTILTSHGNRYLWVQFSNKYSF